GGDAVGAAGAARQPEICRGASAAGNDPGEAGRARAGDRDLEDADPRGIELGGHSLSNRRVAEGAGARGGSAVASLFGNSIEPGISRGQTVSRTWGGLAFCPTLCPPI